MQPSKPAQQHIHVATSDNIAPYCRSCVIAQQLERFTCRAGLSLPKNMSLALGAPAKASVGAPGSVSSLLAEPAPCSKRQPAATALFSHNLACDSCCHAPSTSDVTSADTSDSNSCATCSMVKDTGWCTGMIQLARMDMQMTRVFCAVELS